MSIQGKLIAKEFSNPPTKVLKDIDLLIEDGEFIAITGRSGSGKTTLLYLLSTLDNPSTGKILIEGIDPQEISEEKLHQFRNTHIGYVFQFHYLLPELTLLENVLLPARKLGLQNEKLAFARKLLEDFGLKERMDYFPNQVSGGEQQRAAIARALIMKPKYIFADEPTGNLDTSNSKLVIDLLERVNRETKATVIMVTHEPTFAARAHRQITMVDGRIGSK